MLYVRATPTVIFCIGSADELAVVVNLVDNVGVGVAHVGFLQIDDVPTLSAHIVALVLHSALTQHHADGVLAELLVIGQRVLHLPVAALVPRHASRCVLALGITRVVVFRQRCCTVAPEGEVNGVVEVVLQVVPQLQIERELGHKLVTPVLRRIHVEQC